MHPSPLPYPQTKAINGGSSAPRSSEHSGSEDGTQRPRSRALQRMLEESMGAQGRVIHNSGAAAGSTTAAGLLLGGITGASSSAELAALAVLRSGGSISERTQ
jgi:hypothetical protein